MKKFIVLLFTLTTLLGCSSNSKTTDTKDIDTDKYNLYENNSFSMTYPKEWLITKNVDINSKNVNSPTFIARANDKREKFHQNINIIPVESLNDNFFNFIQKFIVNQKKDLKKYRIIEKSEISIDKQKTMLLTFKAAETDMGNIITFNQTYIDDGKHYYIITCGSQDNSINSSSQKCIDMINSFRLK